jgi:hypothetical protein
MFYGVFYILRHQKIKPDNYGSAYDENKKISFFKQESGNKKFNYSVNRYNIEGQIDEVYKCIGYETIRYNKWYGIKSINKYPEKDVV